MLKEEYYLSALELFAMGVCLSPKPQTLGLCLPLVKARRVRESMFATCTCEDEKSCSEKRRIKGWEKRYVGEG